ncbi:uncharacterized protein (DUF305 family) [Kineococcus rhizosphaerae]|uniref:Uncharacterized protein (DUF305 family) n=2 Tax=Kineococcus rhizosphaerae TaxID=559628 RepID=A0A2T0R490_9ACTN|nr:uncharacterized protein (DUF305 family) [Kineococcus rhizosphaerae]
MLQRHRDADRLMRALTARQVLLAVVGLLLALVLGVLAGRALPTAPGANSVDVGFSRDMATHHAQAVSMAYTAIQTAPSAEVRQLAVDIASTQGNQLGRMQQLLQSWGQPVSSAGTPVMAWMAGTDLHARHEVEQAQGRVMPGMATPAEIARLNGETGQTFEVDFLQLMLRHHAGGIEMAQFGAEHATTSEVRALATAIVNSQRAESQLLTDYLTARGAQPLAAS